MSPLLKALLLPIVQMLLAGVIGYTWGRIKYHRLRRLLFYCAIHEQRIFVRTPSGAYCFANLPFSRAIDCIVDWERRKIKEPHNEYGP